jgi:dimeric dUTPase (all-alpha-NTP-PPase superfamily)
MNFKKLQAMQAKLDEAILADKAPMTAEERFNKTLIALSVEIAEVANCAEHFKFWKDNKGKIDYDRFDVDWDYEGTPIIGYYDYKKGAAYQISYEQAHRLTLIEECSDALHFILSLANQIEYEIDESLIKSFRYPRHPLDTLYVALQNKIINLATGYDKLGSFKSLLSFYTSYAKELGIKPQELEQAYYDKNKINYERLENGY